MTTDQPQPTPDATPDPGSLRHLGETLGGMPADPTHGAFNRAITTVVNALPDYIAEVRRLREENAELTDRNMKLESNLGEACIQIGLMSDEENLHEAESAGPKALASYLCSLGFLKENKTISLLEAQHESDAKEIEQLLKEVQLCTIRFLTR